MRLHGAPREKSKVRKPDWVWLNSATIVFLDCTPKTTTGQYCSIPFVYNNVTYYGCTDVDHNQPWCFLTPQDSGQWGNCGEFLTLFRLCRLGTWGGFPTCGHLIVISALKIRPASWYLHKRCTPQSSNYLFLIEFILTWSPLFIIERTGKR